MLKLGHMLSSRLIFSIETFIGVTLIGMPMLGLPLHAQAAPPTSSTRPQAHVSATPAATPGLSPDLDNRIQAYFTDSRKELGTLEPWQLKIFNEEAVPEYQRFVRGYRLTNPTPNGTANATGAASGSILSADIDFESLRNFLRFYAPKSLKQEKPTILAVLKPQANCSKCISSLPEIKTLVATRLERRGFRVMWIAASELGDPSLMGSGLVSSAAKLATQKNVAGALTVYWQHSLDDEDAMHPDERHYTIHSSLDIRDLSSTEEQLDVTDTGNFERSEGKLLADAFTELGAKLTNLEVSQSEIRREETVVDVVGIRSFAQYQALKNAFQSAVKGGTVEEQKISRGRAIFAVFSNASIQKIQQAISSAKPDGLKLGAPTIEANEIHLEVTAVDQPKAITAPGANGTSGAPGAAPVVPKAPSGNDEGNKGDPEA